MPDGLFHQRPSNPPPVDLDAVVRDVVEFERKDDTTGEVERNVTVPVRWELLSRDEPWALLALKGTSFEPDGLAVPFTVARRIPAQRALEHEVRDHVERTCLALAQLVEERRRVGHSFEAAPAAVSAPAASPKRDRRRRARA